MKKVNEGIKKTNWAMPGPSAWYQLVNGGEGPMFILRRRSCGLGRLRPQRARRLDQMMEEAFGKEQGAAILTPALRKAIPPPGPRAVHYRPDLSYVPAKEAKTASR